jgi:hypothetical protein
MSLTQRCHLLLVSVLILNLSSFLGFADGFSVDRRSVISIVGSTATGILFAPPEDALAITTETGKSKPEVYDYIIDDFTVSIPSNWKVTSKPPVDSNTNKSKRGQNPKLFSAIDFQSGGVITVVREQACNAQEYAQSINSCNIVLPSDNLIFSENTIAKDISKLLIRHDDRDNAALQGTTKVDSYDLNRNVLDLTATTTLPSGGTYRDTMGIDRLSTIDRRLKAKALVTVAPTSVNDEQKSIGQSTSVLTLWLSAPLDEWQKPVMGTKLNEVWDSIKVM